MENRNIDYQKKEDFIDLGEIIKILLNKKLLIIFIILISAVISIFIAKSTPNIYRSSALLEPQESQSSSRAASSIPSGLGGIASLAGIQMPSSSGDRGLYAIEVIKSKIFFKNLLEKDNDYILISLMAMKSYDISTSKAEYDKKIYDFNEKLWVRAVKGNRKITPTYIEAHEHYLSILEIFKDKKTGYVYMAIDHESPVFAQYLLDKIIVEINEITKLNEIQEASDAIDYLTLKQESAGIASIKLSINNLIESQLQALMMSSIRSESLLKIIDPPVVPEIRISPNRAFICITGVFFGFIFSIFFVLIAHFVKQNVLASHKNL